MIPARFDLLLFSVNPETVREAMAGGVAGVVVDWERRGKIERQHGCDTEINADTPDDLRRVRSATTGLVTCRIDGGADAQSEVEQAVSAGASEILVPMVRSVQEVEAIIARVDGRCGVGILIETPDAVAVAPGLARLPLSRVYVGLNDLAIARGSSSIFAAVVDGTVDRLRSQFDVPFGFGGLTLPDRGRPVPCRLLMAEMARLDCQFSFLRRSFRRDAAGVPMAIAVAAIQQAMSSARSRTSRQVIADQAAFCASVAASTTAVAAP